LYIPYEKDRKKLKKMTIQQKQGVKEAAKEFYQDKQRISLEMAIWAMKNAGYTREETVEWLGIEETPKRKV
jgi:hypothetical protein